MHSPAFQEAFQIAVPVARTGAFVVHKCRHCPCTNTMCGSIRPMEHLMFHDSVKPRLSWLYIPAAYAHFIRSRVKAGKVAREGFRGCSVNANGRPPGALGLQEHGRGPVFLRHLAGAERFQLEGEPGDRCDTKLPFRETFWGPLLSHPYDQLRRAQARNSMVESIGKSYVGACQNTGQKRVRRQPVCPPEKQIYKACPPNKIEPKR